jgi:hypothetical protein
MGDHQARVISNESFCFFFQKEALSFFWRAVAWPAAPRQPGAQAVLFCKPDARRKEPKNFHSRERLV